MTRLERTGAFLTTLTLAPLGAFAAGSGKTFAQIVNGSIVPFGNTLVGLVYALCFLFFLIGMVRYLMSHNAESRQQGKQFAIYGVLALALLFVVWGVVRFLVGIISSFNT